MNFSAKLILFGYLPSKKAIHAACVANPTGIKSVSFNSKYLGQELHSIPIESFGSFYWGQVPNLIIDNEPSASDACAQELTVAVRDECVCVSVQDKNRRVDITEPSADPCQFITACNCRS